MARDFWNRPCAARGLHSYRYRLPHGFVMIGARDHRDALLEASRSTDRPQPERLERWNGCDYVPAYEGRGAGA